MTSNNHHKNKMNSIVVLLTVINFIHADIQDLVNLQHRRSHTQDGKFGYGEYLDYSDAGERQHGPEVDRNRAAHRNIRPSIFRNRPTEIPVVISDAVDPNITLDTSHWTEKTTIGQLTAIDLDPCGRVAVFSRGDRVWGADTFDVYGNINREQGAIRQNTIHLYDKYGKKILEWGKNMFYMPHGLTIDSKGNYWLTDVGLHQVFKFDGKDIEKNWDATKNDSSTVVDSDRRSRLDRSIFQPSMILGVAFEFGDDNRRFCKPTAVAVAENGDFFVSDGYCNSRIIKFNRNGERILTWGRTRLATDHVNGLSPSYTMFVPHAVALAEDKNLIYVADRENGRIMCYNSQNGSFHREYKNPIIGTKVYSIDYARERLYLVNGQDFFTTHAFHIRGFVIDVNTGDVVSQFTPGGDDMLAPHDVTVSNDGTEIYVVELNSHRVYRFLQVSEKIIQKFERNETLNFHRHESSTIIEKISIDGSTSTGSGPIVLSIMITSIFIVGLCLVVAVIVARCQKRGCLLSVRKRGYWKADSRENFRLSSLLETRQGKSFKILEKRPNTRDFSKLSTEPETSEDERVDDNLII